MDLALSGSFRMRGTVLGWAGERMRMRMMYYIILHGYPTSCLSATFSQITARKKSMMCESLVSACVTVLYIHRHTYRVVYSGPVHVAMGLKRNIWR